MKFELLFLVSFIATLSQDQPAKTIQVAKRADAPTPVGRPSAAPQGKGSNHPPKEENNPKSESNNGSPITPPNSSAKTESKEGNPSSIGSAFVLNHNILSKIALTYCLKYLL